MSWTKTHIVIEMALVTLSAILVVAFQTSYGWGIIQRNIGDWALISLVVIGWVLFIVVVGIGYFLHIRKGIREFKAP